jgi:hypothetical protein
MSEPAKRSTVLNSKLMWAGYIGQASLGFFGWQVISVMGVATPASVMLAMIAAIALLAMTNVYGVAVLDRAVSAVSNVYGKGGSLDAKQDEPQRPDAA